MKFFSEGRKGKGKPRPIRKVRLASQGILPDKVLMDATEWDKAKTWYLGGMPWKQISKELNVPESTLMTRASRSGLTKVKRDMGDFSLKKKSEQIEHSIETLSKLVRSKLANDAITTLERVDNYQISDIREENTREQVLASISKRSALVFGWSDTSENATVSINLLGALPDKTLNITPSNEIE